jgi:hypothetical protein
MIDVRAPPTQEATAPFHRLRRVWATTHILFWLIYLAFRAAAAASDPSPDAAALFWTLMANRSTVVAVLFVATGLLLAFIAHRCTADSNPVKGAAIGIGGSIALLPFAFWVEAISAEFYLKGVFTLAPPLDDPPFIAYAFRFGWVLLLWSALHSIVGYHFIVLAERDKFARAQALHRQAKLEMLRFQLNPDFLFNTLNTISALVLERRNAEAERMVLRLSEFLRYSLEGDGEALEPIAREIEAQRAYLDIEQQRFGHRFRVRFEVEEEAGRAMAPALILQPFLENAVKHAVDAPGEDGAEIAVGVYRRGDALVLCVDDGAPRRPGQDGERPLNHLAAQQRIALHYGAQGALTAMAKAPSGLRVEIVVPYSPAPERLR